MAQNARELPLGIKAGPGVDVGVAQRIGNNLKSDFSSLGSVDSNDFSLQWFIGRVGLYVKVNSFFVRATSTDHRCDKIEDLPRQPCIG